MTPETEKRAIAFIRTIGNRCAQCLHRDEDNCRRCISRWANEILHDYERDMATAGESEIDYSLSARMVMIADCLVKSARPLLASEIDLKGTCSKQLKYWTLRRMLREGRIGRKMLAHERRYRYFYKAARR